MKKDKEKKKNKKKNLNDSKKAKKAEKNSVEKGTGPKSQSYQFSLTSFAEKYLDYIKQPYELNNGLEIFSAEINTLNFIAENKNVNLTTLANNFKISKSAVSKPVRKLCDKKLILKDQMPGNGREILLTLTAEGRDVLKEVKKLKEERLSGISKIEKDLSDKEKKIISDFLTRILEEVS